jgi:hypothetical protein
MGAEEDGPKRDEETGGLEETAYGVALWAAFASYFSDHKINKNGMSVACWTHGREERFTQLFGRETWGKSALFRLGLSGGGIIEMGL